MNLKNKPLAVTVICGLVLLLSMGLYFTGQTKTFELMVFDKLSKHFRSDKKTSDDVAVILIDEASLEALNPVAGRWPWPRAIYGDLLEFFSIAPPKYVFFDILFTETQEAREDGKLGLHDLALVKATENAGFVYHAMQMLKDNEDERNKTLLNRPLPENFISRMALPHAGNPEWLKDGNNNYYIPFEELAQSARGVAVVEYAPDIDGKFRRTKPVREYRGNLFPIFGLAPFMEGNKAELNEKEMVVGGKSIPLDEEGNVIVNLYSEFNNYSISGVFSSYQSIMAGEFENLIIDPAEFENKIVYIGSSAVGVEDLKATAISSQTPGVYLHASLASNFIQNDFILPKGKSIAIALIFLFTLIATPGIIYLPTYSYKYALSIALALGYFIFCFQNFGNNILYPFVPPFSAIFFSSLFSFGFLLITEGREKNNVKKVFAQFVSKEVLSEVMENYDKYGSVLGGSKEDITILFSDIRSFTSFSDNHSAEEVVKMLNCHFSGMSEEILESRGTIDKFIGDAIMAFWGAPIKIDNHAEKAVIAAIKMINRLEQINRDIKKLGINHEVKIGIGLNSGPAILGNIGSEKKLSYTVIGDAVNLASRLESMTKNFGAPILVSEFTRERLSDAIPCRVIGKVDVRGKKEKVKIFEVMAFKDEETRAKALEIADFANRAHEHFEREEFEKALELYNKLEEGVFKENFVKKCEEKLNLS